jgi:hypothetical protein
MELKPQSVSKRIHFCILVLVDAHIPRDYHAHTTHSCSCNPENLLQEPLEDLDLLGVREFQEFSRVSVCF